MQITASLLALLAIPAARALPVNNAQVAAIGGSNLAARGNSQSELLARHLTPQARGAAKSVQSIYARFAHIQNDGERSVAVVRDLQRRGIIDTLVQAIAAILTELLGTDGAPARHYRRQLTVLGMQTGSIVDDITCLLLKLFGINDSNCAGKPTKRDVSSASNSFTGLNAADPVAMRESLGDLLSHIGRALENEEFGGNNDLFVRAMQDNTELLARQFPATLGVEGLLTVLRQLLDAVLNTLLPLSPRQEYASGTTSAPRATGTNCPPPGTPNDGMYRPGCPGYGRREVDFSARDPDSDNAQLQNTAALLQMLIQQLEPLVQKANDAAGDASSSAAATSDDAAATASAASDDASSSTSDGSESSAVEGALAQLSSSASTPGPSASSDGADASSGATPTVAARDFLEADGFQYVKRQATAADAATDDTSATSTASSATPSTTSSGSSASYSMIKGLVSELFSMFSGGGSGGSSASKTTTADASDSSSSSTFMSLISNVLGGLSSRSVAEGPLKRRVVDGLLERALGGSPLVRGMASMYVDRAVDHVNEIIKARADFEPVWAELKKLGNSHFAHRSVEMQQRDAAEGSLHDVWTNFSRMIDASIAEDKKQAANGGAKRSPSPSVDVKPFADAATKWAQKNLAQDGAKAKRDLDQFQPLAQAAGNFAKQQMKEWTAALNKHNGAQKS